MMDWEKKHFDREEIEDQLRNIHPGSLDACMLRQLLADNDRLTTLVDALKASERALNDALTNEVSRHAQKERALSSAQATIAELRRALDNARGAIVAAPEETGGTNETGEAEVPGGLMAWTVRCAKASLRSR